MNLTFETEQEEDGCWLAEVPELAGVMTYGTTKLDAMTKAKALALRVLDERSTYSNYHQQSSYDN
jgi:predicted RNase H-like HicB family nuclease